MARRVMWIVLVVQCGLMASALGSAEEVVSWPATIPPFPSLTDQDLLGDPAEEEDVAVAPPRLSMEFQEAKLGNVLKIFSQETGINVIAASRIAGQPVTIYFEDVGALDALDQILSAGNLTYERPAGSDIYIVKPKEDEPTQTVTRVYRLRYARVSTSILARAAAVFGSTTPFEAVLDTAGRAGRGGAGTTIRTGVDEILRGLLTDEGHLEVDGRTNSLIITDVPKNFPRLEAALVALDIRTPQILVDAEIIETTLAKIKDLGLEWGTGSEGNLISFTPGSAGRETSFPFGIFGKTRTPSGATPFPTSTLSFNSFQGILQALETDTDTKILARPKVLTLDNESALIRLTANETIGFASTTGETSGTTTSEPERTITGVVLVVTPQVNADGYITMIVEPSVTKTVASNITPPTNQAATRDAKTRSSRTLVRIRSGETLVVGGLIDRSEEEVLRSVPILSGIPFIGKAFQNTEINNTATELIVFVTPHILDEPEMARVASAGRPAAPWGAAPAEHTPQAGREQDGTLSRQELIEATLNRLE